MVGHETDRDHQGGLPLFLSENHVDVGLQPLTRSGASALPSESPFDFRDALENAVAKDGEYRQFVAWDPDLQQLRNSERFAALLPGAGE